MKICSDEVAPRHHGIIKSLKLSEILFHLQEVNYDLRTHPCVGVCTSGVHASDDLEVMMLAGAHSSFWDQLYKIFSKNHFNLGASLLDPWTRALTDGTFINLFLIFLVERNSLTLQCQLLSMIICY